MVTRRRLLVTVFRVCGVAVVLCILLALALVLPTRVTAGAVIALLIFLVRAQGFVLSTVSYHARLPTSVHLTFVTELSEVKVQAAACIK